MILLLAVSLLWAFSFGLVKGLSGLDPTAVALLRLAKTTRIRRFKAEDGEYVYTASTVAVPTAAG